GQPKLGDLLLVVPVIARLDLAGRIAELSVSAGDNDGADALIRVVGQHATRARRFVVGVGMDGHQGEGVWHGPSMPYRAAWRTSGARAIQARCPIARTSAPCC